MAKEGARPSGIGHIIRAAARSPGPRRFFLEPESIFIDQAALITSKRPHTARAQFTLGCQAGYGPYRAAAYISAQPCQIMAVALSTQCQAPNPPLSGEAAAGALRHSEHSHLQSKLNIRVEFFLVVT